MSIVDLYKARNNFKQRADGSGEYAAHVGGERTIYAQCADGLGFYISRDPGNIWNPRWDAFNVTRVNQPVKALEPYRANQQGSVYTRVPADFIDDLIEASGGATDEQRARDIDEEVY